MKKLGLDKMMTCDHRFKVYTKYKKYGEYRKVVRKYVCVRCGARITVSWSEHV
jgi:hypothetical protein